MEQCHFLILVVKFVSYDLDDKIGCRQSHCYACQLNHTSGSWHCQHTRAQTIIYLIISIGSSSKVAFTALK